jgi:nitrite reductase/ring-hydroxylating ferredoxin subunit
MPTVGPAEALNRKAKMWASAIHSLVALPIILLMSAWVWSRKCAKVAMAATTGEATAVAEDGEYKFATMLEEIPKGTRKLVRLQGANILIFWYRNELYAIENRSPAEGAFNQGFEQARFTQNYGILCPSTETEFNMKTGEVMTWLPNNAVLRLLTPPCPPLEVFPVKVEQGEVRVAVPDGGERAYFDGGATSSFERNNVFGIEPRMYLEDGTYIDDDGVTQSQLDPGIIVVTTLAVAIVAVAGTAVCLYIESIPALAAFWIVGFAIVGKQVLDYSDLGQDE